MLRPDKQKTYTRLKAINFWFSSTPQAVVYYKCWSKLRSETSLEETSVQVSGALRAEVVLYRNYLSEVQPRKVFVYGLVANI